MLIQNLKQAVEHFIFVKLQEGAREIIRGGFVNGARGPICQAIKVDGYDYMLFFKREWFYKFGIIYHKKTPIGQSFSVRAINYTLANLSKAALVVVMPDESIRYVPAADAGTYIAYEGTARRPSTESEDEGSIPSTMLSLEDPHQNKNKEKPNLDPGQTTLL